MNRIKSETIASKEGRGGGEDELNIKMINERDYILITFELILRL